MAILPSGEPRRNLQEAFAGKGAVMEAVAQAAFSIAQEHPDKFEVSVNKRESSLDISARTSFEFDKTKFSLRIGLDHHQGRSTQEVLITQEGKAHFDPEAISYRLDISSGSEVDREYTKMASRNEEIVAPDEATRKIKEELSAMLSAIYGGNSSGGTTSYIDNYAETTLKTEGVLTLLQGASKFSLPSGMFGRGPTLKDFREWVKSNQDTRAKSIRGLLG